MNDTNKTPPVHVDEPHEDTPVVATPAHATSMRRKLVIALVAIVIIVVVAVILFIFMMNKSTKDALPDTVGRVERSVADRVVTGAFVSIEGESLVRGDTTISSLGGQSEGGVVLYDFAPYKVSGSPIRALPVTGSGNAVSVSTAAVESIHSQIVESFKASGLSRVESSPTDAAGLLLNPHVIITSYDIYASDHTVCSLARLSSKSGVPQDKQIVSSGCASVADYKKTADAAAPFYTAYKKAKPSTTDTLTLSMPEVVDSNGTKRATVYQLSDGKGGIHTYAQSKADEWMYDKAL